MLFNTLLGVFGVFALLLSGIAAHADEAWRCVPADGGGWRCDPSPEEGSADEAVRDRSATADLGEALARRYWQPRSAVAAQQLAGVPEYCRGVYVLPLPARTDGRPPDSLPVTAQADDLEYLIDREIRLSGNVEAAQGDRSFLADELTLDPVTRDAQLRGDVVLMDPSTVLASNSVQANLDTKAARLDDVGFLLPRASYRGDAARVSRNESGDLALDDARLTRCEPGSRTWTLTGSRIEIPEGETFGTARNAVVRVQRVPVFYTPYIKFPVTGDRQSGFLFPNLEYSDDNGLDVGIPYYLNLAPNYDATVIPRYLTERGPAVEGEFRHLSQTSETTLGGAFLHEDDRFDGEIERNEYDERQAAGENLPPFEPADRWLYGADHRGRFGRIRTRVDYTAVSDIDYFRDLGTDLSVSNQVELERLGRVEYVQGPLVARLWVQRFQRLDVSREEYRRLPQLDVALDQRLLGPLRIALDASWASFDRPNDTLRGLNRVVGERLHAAPSLSIPLEWPFGFFNATAGFRYTAYDLRDAEALDDDSPTREIGFGHVGGGLFFERDLSWFGMPMVQTLEPRLYYLYQEFADQSQLPRFDTSALTFGYQSLFRDNTFSGYDRFVDADQLSAGVTTRFTDALNGTEYVRLSVGQIAYFDDRQVTLNGAPDADDRHDGSALATEASARLFGDLRLTGTLVWDPYDHQTDEGAFGLNFQPDARRIVNLGFRRRGQTDVEQTDFSVYWPVSRSFSVLGRWNYDLDSGRTIEGFGGIEYNNCCLRLRLVARRYLQTRGGRVLQGVEPDEGIYFQLVLKGLAGFGNTVESVMERGIKGYRYEGTGGP